MAKTSATNATASGAWQYGNAAGDAFAKEDVQNLGANFDAHDHSSTKGLAVARAASGIALASPVVSGAAAAAAGTLGFSGTNLLVGDGSAIESVNVGAWTSMAGGIVLSQSSVITATINIAHYIKVGRMASVFIQLTASAGGTISQPLIVSGLAAAVAPLTANGAVVVGTAYVGSSPPRVGALVMAASNQLEIQIDNNAGVYGVAPAVAIVNGWVITMSGTWETAS